MCMIAYERNVDAELCMTYDDSGNQSLRSSTLHCRQLEPKPCKAIEPLSCSSRQNRLRELQIQPCRPRYNPLFPLISARSPSRPILSTLGAPQIITFPVPFSTHPFFFTQSRSDNRLQRVGNNDHPVELGLVLELELMSEGEECVGVEWGIPDDNADGELV
jgi:hypothetical protein